MKFVIAIYGSCVFKSRCGWDKRLRFERTTFLTFPRNAATSVATAFLRNFASFAGHFFALSKEKNGSPSDNFGNPGDSRGNYVSSRAHDK